MKKCVVVLSWWLDSTVSMYYASKVLWYDIVWALSFNYWQKHKKELNYAKISCDKLGVEHKIIDLSCISWLLDSALTNEWAEIPEWHYEEENMKATVVPNRNMIMASITAGYGISKWADYVVLWVHQGDHAIYPDCRKEFIEKLNEAIKICDRHPIELLTPVLEVDKADIVRMGIESNVPFEDTWTCYKWEEVPCGKCWSCQERIYAFDKNWIIDPLYS